MKDLRFAFIDEVADSLRGYALLREEDNVLILPPNKVYKVNSTAFKILEKLLSGTKAKDLSILKDDKLKETVSFFDALKRAADNGDIPSGPALERTPYSFDYTRLPVLGEIAVTYRCNNRCRFCYLGGDTRGVKEMTLGQIKKIIDIFKEKAKIPFFSFTGGEPLLREDLETCAKYAEKRGLRTNLITNGTLADKSRARSLYRHGIRTAQVSVEAPEEAVHDKLTGVPGSFNKTLKGIEALLSVGISVQTNTTITSENVGVAEKMPDFLSSLGIKRFSMNLFIPVGEGSRNRDLFFPYSGVGPVIDAVKKRAQENNLTFYWYSPIPHCRYNPLTKGLGNKSCAAMDGLISVSPAGDVPPCSSYPESMGNLLRETFESIWFSNKAAFFKKKEYAPAICKTCDKFLACQGACPLYWRYAGTGELCETNSAKGGAAS